MQTAVANPKSQSDASGQPPVALSQYLVPSLAAVLLIGGSVIIHGIWTERFRPRETTTEQKILAERLKNLPLSFGDWEGEVVPMDEKQRQAARIVGDFSVRFRNKVAADQEVMVMVACGHGTDMKNHTPDQCYVAQGFSAADEERTYPIDMQPKPAEFFTCRFRKEVPGQGPQNIRIFWSFGENGEWTAPSFRGLITTRPAIYKMYATTVAPKDVRESPQESAAVGFLREFMPLVNQALFPPEASSSSADQPESLPKESAPSTAS